MEYYVGLDVSLKQTARRQLCRPDVSAVQRHTCSGPPDHLKTRLRPPPCPGRTLSAIWNYMCGGRHASTVTGTAPDQFGSK